MIDYAQQSMTTEKQQNLIFTKLKQGYCKSKKIWQKSKGSKNQQQSFLDASIRKVKNKINAQLRMW